MWGSKGWQGKPWRGGKGRTTDGFAPATSLEIHLRYLPGTSALHPERRSGSILYVQPFDAGGDGWRQPPVSLLGGVHLGQRHLQGPHPDRQRTPFRTDAGVL